MWQKLLLTCVLAWFDAAGAFGEIYLAVSAPIVMTVPSGELYLKSRLPPFPPPVAVDLAPTSVHNPRELLLRWMSCIALSFLSSR